MSRGAAELLEIYEATGDENAFDEAVAAWEAIVAWNESRGYDLQAEWPRRELARVHLVRDDLA